MPPPLRRSGVIAGGNDCHLDRSEAERRNPFPLPFVEATLIRPFGPRNDTEGCSLVRAGNGGQAIPMKGTGACPYRRV